jgi:hypothetical protein
MPITLTTPKVVSSPGEPSITYSQLKIAGFDFPPPGRRIVMKLQYGDTVDGAWLSKARIFKHIVQDVQEVSSPQYNEETEEVVDVVSQEAALEFSELHAVELVGDDVDGMLVFDVVALHLYQHLLACNAADPDYQGVIV